MDGYMGKLLRVDLTHRTVAVEELDARLAKDYIGGTGLGVRLAYDRIFPRTDALGARNKLFFITGPLTGTIFPTAGRYQVVFKSPLTDILCDSSSGGFWGAELKRAGYDCLIIEGCSTEPVYLYINNDLVEIRDASHLWGMDALEVQEAVKEAIGQERARIAAIGLAGEREVSLACIINDEGRAAGRGGSGAVMGSKRLKAIAVRGTKKVPLADEATFRTLVKRINRGEWAANPGWTDLSPYGTATLMDNNWRIGDVPVKNWQIGMWEEGSLKLGGEKMAQTILTKRIGCYRCPIRCGRWVRVDEGPYRMEGPGPEYETLAAFGTMTMVDDLEAVAYVNDLCNRYGLDTISTGTTIAFAIECYERGLLTRDQVGDIDLTWGNAEALVRVTELVGKREGLGALLGLGMRRVAERMGGEAMDFAYQVKGLEAPMHDPRTYFSLAATYATSPRGACHLHGASHIYESNDALPEWGLTKFSGRHVNEGKGIVAKVAQDHAAILNSLVICYFVPFYYAMQPSDLAAFLSAATGIQYTSEQLHRIGERINAVHRAYNNLCGITRADDRLPPRALQHTAESENAGQVPDLEYILKEFYEASEWTADGKPSRERLMRLGLEDIAKDLYRSVEE